MGWSGLSQQVSAQSKDSNSVKTELHTGASWEGMCERILVTTVKSTLKRDSDRKFQVLFTKTLSPSSPHHETLWWGGGGLARKIDDPFISSYWFEINERRHQTQEQ